jgi:uncharacterized protein
MTVSVEDAPERRRYEVLVDGRLAGILRYARGERVIRLVHTEVDESIEGQGLGSQLAKFALDDARARGLRVRPDCPFVSAWIGRHPEYADLVEPATARSDAV